MTITSFFLLIYIFSALVLGTLLNLACTLDQALPQEMRGSVLMQSVSSKASVQDLRRHVQHMQYLAPCFKASLNGTLALEPSRDGAPIWLSPENHLRIPNKTIRLQVPTISMATPLPNRFPLCMLL